MLDWISFPNLTSYYNTDSLKSTLERLVDFDRINAKTMRFSVGAVNVSTGSLTFFDNDTIAIHPEHVMASAALPPGFPAVEIDGEHYWDGGLISNTPLQYVLDYLPRRSRSVSRSWTRADEPRRSQRAGEGHPLFRPHTRGNGSDAGEA
jgi:NTE family protein